MELKLKKNSVFALHHVDFTYEGQKKILFQDLSFSIKFGESVAILVPDGEGRTTLLKLMAGMEEPAKGRVFINEFPVDKLPEDVLNDYRAQIGFVFPEGALINNLSIFDNVALPLRYHANIEEHRVIERVKETLSFFHIENFADERPAYVSTYVRKIAGIARAFVMTPPAFFFDNIFSGLTRKQVIELSIYLQQAFEQSEATYVFTSNDPDLAQHHAKRVIFIKNGRCHFDGTFPEFFNSTDVGVQSFIKNSMVQAA